MCQEQCCERNGLSCTCDLEDTSCLQCGKYAGTGAFCSEDCYHKYVDDAYAANFERDVKKDAYPF